MKGIGHIFTVSLFLLLFQTPSEIVRAQDLMWKERLTGTGNNVVGKSAIDSKNNIYLIGQFSGTCDNVTPVLITKGGNDIYFAKFNSNGVLLWAKQLGGTLSDLATSLVISVDDQYIYLTGTFQGTLYGDNSTSIVSSGADDGFLAKYNNNGDLIWLKRIAYGIDANIQRPGYLKIDRNNKIVLGGTFFKNLTLGDDINNITFSTSSSVGMFISQFDLDGNLIKAKKFEATGSPSQLYVLDIDNTGYYLSGYFAGDLITDFPTKTSNGSSDMFVYKVDENLVGQWLIKIGGTGSDLLFSCSTDLQGNFYLGGQFSGPTMTIDSTTTGIISKKNFTNVSNGTADIFFAKYSSDGILQWFNTAGSPGNDYLYRALYRNGDFIVAGQYSGTMTFNNQTITCNGGSDALAIVHDYKDNLKYLIPIKGSGNDVGETALVDNNGNFIVIGDYASPTITFGDNSTLTNSQGDGTKDMFIAKYDKASLQKVSKNISCPGGADGTIDLTPMGTVVPPLTYSWIKRDDPAYTASTEDISGLKAGRYVVTFTDALGYTKKDSVTLTEPVPLSATVASTPASCHNMTNGTISLSNTAGGTAPYSYTWDGTGSGINATAQNQTAVSYGTYMVTITDKNECTLVFNNIGVSQPDPVSFKGSSTTDIVLSPSSPGAVTLAVNGGSLSYSSFAWTGPSNTSFSTQSLSGLYTGGTYSVHVTDTNGCTGDTSFIVNYSTELIAYVQSKQDINCFGNTTGSITAGARNAIGNVTYLWDDPLHSTTPSITNLAAGTYHVTVTDDGALPGHEQAVAEVILSQPKAVLQVNSVAVTQIVCHDRNDGILDASVTGGTMPYSYQWTRDGNMYANTEDLSNLSQGSYSLTVTDANQCTSNGSGSITNPDPIRSTINAVKPVTCEGGKNDGSITFDATTGGWPGYTYLWSNGLTTQNISLLSAGTYTLTITDSHNCKTLVTQKVDYESPMTISSDVSDVRCKGGSSGAVSLTVNGGHLPLAYKWNTGDVSQNLSDLATGSYSVTVTDSKSCQKTYVTPVGEPLTLSISSTGQTDVSCNGANDGTLEVSGVLGGTQPYAYSWSAGTGLGSTISSLAPGDYTVTVTDAHDCEASASFHITEPPSLALTEIASSHADPVCNNAATGTIELSASGGSGQYQYSFNHSQWSDNPLFSGLTAGTYTFRVRDRQAVNCWLDIPQPVIVTQPPAITETSLAEKDVTCKGSNNGTISYNVSGGTGALTYVLKLNGIATGNTTGTVSGSFTGLLPGNGYTLEVTDVNSCGPLVSSVVSINEPPALTITVDSVSNANSSTPWNGCRKVNACGGSGSYTFTLSNICQSIGLFQGLAPGTYTITVTDQNGCGSVTSNALTVSDVTGIQSVRTGIVKIYPNPVSDELFIYFGDAFAKGDVYIEVVTMGGQVVSRETVDMTSLADNIHKLHLGSLPRGIYLLKINDQVLRDKIVLQ